MFIFKRINNFNIINFDLELRKEKKNNDLKCWREWERCANGGEAKLL